MPPAFNLSQDQTLQFDLDLFAPCGATHLESTKNFISENSCLSMSVCRSLRTQFRRTWQSPSNAHAYRLYVVNEPCCLPSRLAPRFACFAAMSEAFNYGSFFRGLSTRFAFFDSLASLPRCSRVAFCRAFDYGSSLKRLSIGGFCF